MSAARRPIVRQTVILAAGNGSRLKGSHRGLPKPLVHVAGKPLIEHALNQAEAAGCDEAIVVVGNQAELVTAHLDGIATSLRITTVLNERYHDPNGVSLLAAKPHVDERFYLQMADHIFVEPVLQRLDTDEVPLECCRLLVDYTPAAGLDEDDATKVRVSDGRIRAIGKTLRPYDAVDVGFFLLNSRIFEALEAAALEAPPSVSAGMTRLAEQGLLAPVALEGVRWFDVDTAHDWGRAQRLLGAHATASVTG